MALEERERVHVDLKHSDGCGTAYGFGNRHGCGSTGSLLLIMNDRNKPTADAGQKE
jgi:hypothetical protein